MCVSRSKCVPEGISFDCVRFDISIGSLGYPQEKIMTIILGPKVQPAWLWQIAAGIQRFLSRSTLRPASTCSYSGPRLDDTSRCMWESGLSGCFEAHFAYLCRNIVLVMGLYFRGAANPSFCNILDLEQRDWVVPQIMLSKTLTPDPMISTLLPMVVQIVPFLLCLVEKLVPHVEPRQNCL